MYVPDCVLLQRGRELILAELRIPARFWNGTDVHQLPDTMRRQPLEKLLDGQRGVADGKNGQGFTTARRYERIAAKSASL
jgi:hypothetical protein